MMERILLSVLCEVEWALVHSGKGCGGRDTLRVIAREKGQA